MCCLSIPSVIEGNESVCPQVILSVKRDGNLTETDV